MVAFCQLCIINEIDDDEEEEDDQERSGDADRQSEWPVNGNRVFYSILFYSKKSRLGRHKCRDTARAPNNVS